MIRFVYEWWIELVVAATVVGLGVLVYVNGSARIRRAVGQARADVERGER